MKYIKKLLACFITAGVFILPFAAEAAGTTDPVILHSPVMAGANINREDYVGYTWRNDTENNTGMPRHFRMASSSFGKANTKYGLDENYHVSRKGLEKLHMSGSAEYSVEQFQNMVKAIGDKWEIYVIDLRQECHLFANGYSMSWYGKRDWSNLGKNAEEVESEEVHLAQQIAGKNIEISSLNDDKGSGDTITLNINNVMTERQLVEGYGIKYYRFPCTDHIWPDAKQIDNFIELFKNLPDNAWLHFHCVGGVGRTGAFMCIYDIMRNPDVSLKDIVYRQHLLGANYLLDPGDDSWKGPYKAEGSLMLMAFYSYAHECGPEGYKVSWSEWLVNH